MFPPEGWDIDLLVAAVRGFLGYDFVTAALTICVSFIFAGRVFRWALRIGGLGRD